ncbi:MAG: hypothetical protein DRI61_14385 [Chloroflexi bacterium]|nr:MAG: hypothetical protein DRI61_14385 [Chloroflexota bacterium]
MEFYMFCLFLNCLRYLYHEGIILNRAKPASRSYYKGFFIFSFGYEVRDFYSVVDHTDLGLSKPELLDKGLLNVF